MLHLTFIIILLPSKYELIMLPSNHSFLQYCKSCLDKKQKQKKTYQSIILFQANISKNNSEKFNMAIAHFDNEQLVSTIIISYFWSTNNIFAEENNWLNI